jgi:hypothetical protein
MEEEVADRTTVADLRPIDKPIIASPWRTEWGAEMSLGYADWFLLVGVKVHLHSLAWTLGLRRDWLDRGLALRFGAQGFHGRGTHRSDTGTETIGLNLLQVPIEFLFGNKKPKIAYVHGLIGGSLGVAVVTGSCKDEFGQPCEGYDEFSGIAFSVRPLNLGVGSLFFIPAGRRAHPTLSATFRIDPASLLIAGGGFIADLQVGAGLRF